MIKARATDKDLVVEILSRSFDANPSVNYMVCQDGKRAKRIAALMDYVFEMCLMFGNVWLSDNRKGCALTLYPGDKRATFKTIWLDAKLIFKAIGIRKVKAALYREARIKEKQQKQAMTYLWFIGVDPAGQHKGTGSKLLAEVIAFSGEQGLPVYLETSVQQNLAWYKRFGFGLYDRMELPYTLYFLKR
jgi:ribosomal protein S18 acetylase RimI-like enzyme